MVGVAVSSRRNASRPRIMASLLMRAIVAAAFAAVSSAAAGEFEEKTYEAITPNQENFDILANPRLRCPIVPTAAGFSWKEDWREVYVLEIGADDNAESAAPWRVTIRPPRFADHPDSLADGLKLVLSSENARPGERFRTADLPRAEYGDGKKAFYCFEIATGEAFREPPPIYLVSTLLPLRSDAPLSVFSRSYKDPPNFVAASKAWADCHDTQSECLARYPAGESPDDPQTAPLWTDGMLAADVGVRRAALKQAFEPIVWIGLEQYTPDIEGRYGICKGAKCGGHCTGFLIAPRLVMTNAHCLLKNAKDGSGHLDRRRYALRGWLRPAQGDQGGGHLTPHFQKLTPLFSGAPDLSWRKNGRTHGSIDYAILWIEDGDWSPGRSDFAEVRPLPLAQSDNWPSGSRRQLTIIGYPAVNALTLSLDAFCRDFSASNNEILQHRCDTLGGSSGSPVFDRDLRAVRALHYGANFAYVRDGHEGNLLDCWSDDPERNKCYNRAARLDSIRAHIAHLMEAKGADGRTLGDLAKDCGAELSDSLIKPLWHGGHLATAPDNSTVETFEIPLLPGERAVSERTLIAAYRSLPERLLPDDLRSQRNSGPICSTNG